MLRLVIVYKGATQEKLNSSTGAGYIKNHHLK